MDRHELLSQILSGLEKVGDLEACGRIPPELRSCKPILSHRIRQVPFLRFPRSLGIPFEVILFRQLTFKPRDRQPEGP